MMNGKRKSVLQRMDDLVGWTGIPRFICLQPRMRRLKWMPIFALAWVTAGLAESFLIPRRAYFGVILISTAMGVAVALSQMGPMRPKKPDESADEREHLWRTRSMLFTFATIGLVAWLGILGLAGYTLWSGLYGWTVKSPDAPLVTLSYWLMALAEYLMVLFIILPTLHASWTVPDMIEEEPDEEGGLKFVRPRRR